MDTSQASPTQQNDDRDYEPHTRDDSIIPATQLDYQQAADNAPEEAAQADAEAEEIINFARFSFHEINSDSQQTDIEPSSPVLGPGPSLSNSRRGWHMRTSSSQQHSSLQRPETQTPFRQAHPAPETPAAANNPFAGNAMFGGQAIAATQLFGQTQQSSPFKIGSPTSSRPTPAMQMHQSISPNMAESPFQDGFNITPPTVRSNARHVPTSVPRGAGSSLHTPAPGRWRGYVGQDTPTAAVARNTQREPMAHYESMQESQERRKRQRTKSPPRQTNGSDSDDEKKTAKAKRMRVEEIKKAVDQDLAQVRTPRTGFRGDVQVPDTTRKDRNAQASRSLPVIEDEVDEDEGSTVADSQEPTLTARRLGALTTVPRSPDQPERPERPAAEPGYVSSNERVPDSTTCTQTKEVENPPAPSATQPASPDGRLPHTSPDVDVILETSPLRQPDPDVEADTIEAPEPSLHNHDSFDRLPEPSRRSGRVARPSAKAKLVMSDDVGTPKVTKSTGSATISSTEKNRSYSNVLVIPESSPRLQPRASIPNLPSSPPAPPSALPVSVVQAADEPRTPDAPQSTAPAVMSGSSSSLSSLSTMTDPSMPSTQEASVVGTPRSRPELPQLRTALDGLKGSHFKYRRSGRIPRRGSTSTDELGRSSTPVGFENSIIKPAKKAPFKSIRTAPQPGGDKLFSGMAFAVSFQSQRPGENGDAFDKRMELGKEVEGIIIDGGGRLLAEGFNELFDSAALRSMAISPTSEGDAPSSNNLGLAEDSRGLGFTALVADGHSRKVKYMQALALGLPCISDRWITDCVAKRAILDWAPYLLCAGQSTFLRGAVRSRFLTPYPAAEARLVDVVEQRAQLLAGSKILLVMKKSRQEDKKMLYVFLTHVLGASLLRAYGMADAQEMMRHRDQLGSPFDLVYIDENTGTEQALFERTAAPRRKRATQTQLPRRVRTLNDELVIQSLILGRMIEEGEWEA
ncbi:hypothetical protein F5X68DRAFT_273996 [Plectosphaerella plurivora]|uniref:BRCT domain-containing protein n=1 Tax=Plectosphaerella plurivora TaxID=936078 RepID=A0A9P8VGS3_9PEZI|nr:hypothetical protein F5X68DRAFT_273996 [Plectosphaerella plurivora]